MALQSNAILSIYELKAALKLQETEKEELLEGLINSASDFIEGSLNRRLKTQTYTAVRFDGTGSKYLFPEFPVTTLTSVVLDETTQTLWLPGDSGEPKDKDVILLDGPDPKWGRWALYRDLKWTKGMLNIKMTYTAGYGATTPANMPAMPEDLKQACIIIARHWYYLQDRQRQGLYSRRMSGESVSYVQTSLPREAVPLLNRYRRHAIVGI